MKKTLPMRLLAIVLCVAMLVTVTPIFASAEGSATYLDYNETTGAVDLEREVEDVNVIDEAADMFVTGWNLVEGDVEFETRITLPKDVNLILANGATLTADKGITVAADGDFAIYAQSNDADTMGKLIVPEGQDAYDNGIGSVNRNNCGDISIYGGDVTAYGGYFSAAIGGPFKGQCGDISIYGGIVTAQGGNVAAAIGSTEGGGCGDITISGGTVNAQTGNSAAGIGSGDNSTCGKITISGGTVTARGGSYGGGAGIGSGYEGSSCGDITISGGVVNARGGSESAGIGSGEESSCSSIIISGGIVTAEGGDRGAGIGCGNCIDPTMGSPASCGDVTITGGVVFAQGGEWAPGIGCCVLLGHATEETKSASCETITISGGYIKASAGKNASVFIGVSGDERAEEAVIDRSCTSIEKNGAQYINYEPFAAKAPTCAESGFLAYYKDYVSGNYYAEFPFTEDGLIGDDAALALWKASGGDGYIASLPHVDEDEDGVCDVCLGIRTPYLDYNKTTGLVDLEREAGVQNVIDEATDSFVTGWNLVEGNVEFESRITLPKNVNLILANGATLTAKKGITVAEDGDFAIYAQSNDADTMGTLVVPNSVEGYKPGIGSDKSKSCGNISVYGGMVVAQGGMYAAGIGGGEIGGSCGNVTIYGGVVTATGGAYGAGIGTGYNAACGNITIIGGNITVQGGYKGAGIGSGYYDCSCGKVTVKGGYVKATSGGEGAKTIGAGCDTDDVLVSIDSSCTSDTKDGVQYINYKILGKDPTCTESGFKAYFQDPVSGDFYDALPLTEDTLIGDATALAAWKAKGGAGYLAPLPHPDEDDDDVCDVCESALTVYLDYSEATGKVDAKRKIVADSVIDQATDAFVTGWNVVEGSLEFEERITLPKDVNLILTDGATLIAKKGITVAEDGDFAIYAQSNDVATMGKLIVPSTDTFDAGIGSIDAGSCGNITIYGGVVTATAGSYGAGIGGGYYSACGDITIYDGIVTAQGGYEAAGIGSGYYALSCGAVTILGGYVKATSGDENAEPIGAGCDTDVVSVSIDSTCAVVTKDGVQYINYTISGKEPTCTESGFKSYFQDPISGDFYDAVPLTTDTLIGDATALAAWKAKGGNGYVAPLPHTDEDDDDVCDVCTAALTPYLDYNATTGKVDTVRKIVIDNVIDEATDSFVTGWNLVKGDVEFESRIVLPKDVNLILANGATLTADKGIRVAADGDFAVYAQSNDADTMGELIALNEDHFCAGIGGSDEAPCGDIAIYGGVVTAQGGMYAAGIGSGFLSACGTVTIYGGVVTAIGSTCAAGIGGGYDSACDGVTIYGGIVHAQGGGYGAGIGSGFSGSCGKVTIKAGYVAAMTGDGAAPIGRGNYSDDVEVSIDTSCTSVLQSGAQYINYEPFATVEPTCTESGLVAYYKDYISGNYYTEFPFEEDGLIGDDAALAAWKAEDGDGYLAALGHDWQYVNDSIHECSRCKSTEAHTGVDEDYICDVCEGVLLETAIEDAVDEINAAVGDNPSTELSNMAEDILHDLRSSASPAEALSIKNDGLAAINAYLGALADAKTVAKAALSDVAGENPSAAVKASLDTVCGMIDAANTIASVAAIKEAVLPVITAQVAAEAEAAAQTLASAKAAAKAALSDATGEDPSEALATVLSDACDAVDEAATVAAVQTAEEAGFAAIMEQLATEAADKAATEKAEAEALAAAKGAAKAALDAAADPVGSDAQAQVLATAKAAVDAAETLDGVAAAKADGLSAIAAQKATDLAAKVAELKADITDNLLLSAKCNEAKEVLYAALDALDAAATVSDANSIYTTAKEEANSKDVTFAGKLTDYKATFPLAITDAVSEETEQFVEAVLTALNNATSIAALDEIYEDNAPLVSFHVTKDNMLAQCKEILETGDDSDAMKALFEMTVEKLSETTNMEELEEAYTYCADQIEMQRERESYFPECEMILASDEYSDNVKALVRELVEALNAAESLDEIEYVIDEYGPAINLQAARDEWMAELTELLPDEPSDAVTAIIEDAGELILYGEDASIFDNVFDIARQAVEKQLAAEANQAAMEAVLKQTQDDLAEANEAIDALNDTVKSKDATIAEKQAALDTATEQLNAAKADLETAKADLETAKANVEQLEGTVSEQEKSLAQAEQDIKDLQAEIDRLKALLDDDPTVTDPTVTDPTDPTETDPTDPTGTDPDDGMLGDANGDGAVNMKDVLLMRKFLAGVDVEYNAENADCNGDGTVNMKDVLLMRKFLAGIVDKLGA